MRIKTILIPRNTKGEIGFRTYEQFEQPSYEFPLVFREQGYTDPNYDLKKVGQIRDGGDGGTMDVVIHRVPEDIEQTLHWEKSADLPRLLAGGNLVHLQTLASLAIYLLDVAGSPAGDGLDHADHGNGD